MHAGRVVALGSPAELKQSLGAGRLLHVIPSDLLASMSALQAQPGIQDVAVFGGGLHVKVAETAKAEPVVREALSKAGIRIGLLETIAAAMEDVFVNLIEEQEHARS